jgi:hypothetical protein
MVDDFEYVEDVVADMTKWVILQVKGWQCNKPSP